MFEYEKLWALLKEKNLKKNDLKKMTGITPNTLSKLSKNENVSLDVLNRICVSLECDIGDIVEHVYTPYRADETLGTFISNKSEAVHNWFGYLEGYSKNLVEIELEKLSGIKAVYDPFGGSGTTPLVSKMNNIDAYFSEANPVMEYISKAKTLGSFEIASSPKLKEELQSQIESLKVYMNKQRQSRTKVPKEFGGFEKYFESENLFYIQKYQFFINSKIENMVIKPIFNVALAGVAVSTSKMIRRGDLRFAKGKEIEKTNKDFIKEIFNKLDILYADIISLEVNDAKVKFLTNDVRDIEENDLVDAIITSPPYLNGTNYIRNTKLELKLLGFIKEESELSQMHKVGIVAGINNVSKGSGDYTPMNEIKLLIDEISKVSYDSRIERMIAGYFNDMDKVFKKLSQILKEDGHFIMDIGDSQFAGIHVPTHSILENIALKHGFIIYSDEVIRSRKSRSGFELTQRIMRFKLKKKSYAEKAEKFVRELNFQNKGRNWGNKWHSLCSYRGKLKPAIANELILTFSNEGDRILDPMGGVGTIPFEALLNNRVGISNDLSSLAYHVTSAKLNPPQKVEVEQEVDLLEKFINKEKTRYVEMSEYHDFGLNKTLREYFDDETLGEIVASREYFIKKKTHSNIDSFIISCLMHILHGNRPYALSRTSHPLTPYAPKGDFVYKSVIEHLKRKVNLMYNSKDFYKWPKGESYNINSVNLYKIGIDKVDLIITSPPFASSFKFYTQNWMRLWFSGWEPEDFKSVNSDYFDDEQNKNFDIYYKYFEMASNLLVDKGKMILHLGKSDKFDMSEELVKRCGKWFNIIYSGDENVSNGEKFGISDTGSTIAHQFLFLEKK